MKWKAVVTYVVDDTTHQDTFIGHRISTQILDGDGPPPLRSLIITYDGRGRKTEVFHCYAWMIRKTQVKK